MERRTEVKHLAVALVAVVGCVGGTAYLIGVVGDSRATAILECFVIIGIVGILLGLRYPSVWPSLHNRLRVAFKLDRS